MDVHCTTVLVHAVQQTCGHLHTLTLSHSAARSGKYRSKLKARRKDGHADDLNAIFIPALLREYLASLRSYEPKARLALLRAH